MRATTSRQAGPMVALLAVLLAVTAAAALYFEMPEPHIDNTNKVAITLEPGEALRVTFVGDSLDYGLYATEADLGFHPLMVEAWRAGGPVTDTPLNSLGGTANRALGNDDIPVDQHLVVVELGTNDFSRQSHRDFRRDYDELLSRLRLASPKGALLCIGPWRPADAAQRFETIVEDLCEARGGVFRSVSDLSENAQMKGPPGIPTFGGPSDSFHPNDRGHRAIADRMLAAVSVDRLGA
ncbi:SGNH/GDSL hydrolase family protein [Mycolicibacterium vaccae]|uniref:SGNH/GDSL hydrolase family protein n=1 Tax=Mycolicibacterium vaccae TaxID=1810 RepID=UPI003CFD0229